MLRLDEWPLLLACLLIVGGVGLANWAQTNGQRITLRDVRFPGADGQLLAGYLYLPPGVTAQHPAPAVLAVHGYINTRETQDGFAIELARRGIVVLAIDQRGHGHSAPPAFAAGFGGPDALAWLRRQPQVDANRIGLIGHSMGGWAILAAAAAHPDGYRAMALVGSAPGTFGAPGGTTVFPRNLAVVFSRWDEFADLMWSVPTGRDLARSPKLAEVFGTGATGVMQDRLYGSFKDGTARTYVVPQTTHPGDHLSPYTIGAVVHWMQLGLGLRVTENSAQTWYWKELGTLLAMLGGVLLLAAVPRALIKTPLFAGLRGEPAAVSAGMGTLAFTALLPVALYFPLFKVADTLIPLSAHFPQQLTNGLLLWVIVVGLITMVALLVQRARGARRQGLGWASQQIACTLGAVVLAGITVAIWLGVLMLCERWFQVDFRFWVVAMKSPAVWHWPMLLSYGPALVAFFLLSHAATSGLIDGRIWLIDAWLRQTMAYCGGFILLLAIQYVALFLDQPLLLGEPLLTIVGIQFLALLAFAALVHASCYRATGTVWLGAVINGLWITIVVVSGQATQFAVS